MPRPCFALVPNVLLQHFNKLAHLGRHIFLPVIDQLAPHHDLVALRIQNDQLALLEVLAHHIFRQKGDAPILQQKPGDHIGIAHFPAGVELKPLFGQLLFHGIAVADPLFRQIQRLFQQPFQGDLPLPCQRRMAGRHEKDVFRPLGHFDPLGEIHL